MKAVYLPKDFSRNPVNSYARHYTPNRVVYAGQRDRSIINIEASQSDSYPDRIFWSIFNQYKKRILRKYANSLNRAKSSAYHRIGVLPDIFEFRREAWQIDVNTRNSFLGGSKNNLMTTYSEQDKSWNASISELKLPPLSTDSITVLRRE